MATRLITVNDILAGQARRRHTSLPSPRSTRTVWSLAMPRSTPTNRRSARADRRSSSLAL